MPVEVHALPYALDEWSYSGHMCMARALLRGIGRQALAGGSGSRIRVLIGLAALCLTTWVTSLFYDLALGKLVGATVFMVIVSFVWLVHANWTNAVATAAQQAGWVALWLDMYTKAVLGMMIAIPDAPLADEAMEEDLTTRKVTGHTSASIVLCSVAGDSGMAVKLDAGLRQYLRQRVGIQALRWFVPARNEADLHLATECMNYEIVALMTRTQTASRDVTNSVPAEQLASLPYSVRKGTIVVLSQDLDNEDPKDK